MLRGLKAPQRCDLERINKGTSMYRARKKTSSVLFIYHTYKTLTTELRFLSAKTCLTLLT